MMEADLRNNSNLKQFLLFNGNVKLTGTKIGAGSYGIVEEVEISGTICAAKKLHDIVVSHDEIRKASDQFVKECQLMSTLRHPCIVQFLGVCFFPGSQLPALIMERMQIDLHNFLGPVYDPPSDPSKQPFPLSLKCSILQNVASGLAYLHERTPPIIHRDLSARNVLLTSGMVAKIADLGVARMLPRAAATMTTAPGTAIYMPPEAQEADSNDHSKYGASIDIFSFGVVAIFTLSETFPYKLLAPNYQEGGRLIPRTELQRRNKYMQIIYKELREDHPLLQMIKRCLDFSARRPNIREVLGLLEEARGEHSDDEMETNKLLKAMETLQTKPWDQISSADAKQPPEFIHSQLTVKCHKKKKAPCAMSRGSATTDDQYAYFTPCSSDSVYRYEWSTENWDQITPCPHRDSGLVIINGELTAVGGYDGCRPTNEVFTYTQQKEWVKKHQQMKSARFQAAVVSTEDGKYVFAIGGQSDTWTATVEVFDVKSGEWYEIKNMPQPLTLPSATICGNELRIMGEKCKGYSCSLQPLLSNDQPIALEWRPLPRLPINGSTAATLSQHLVIIGGDIPDEQANMLHGVDPDVNSIHQLVKGKWMKIGAMSVTRSECFVVSASPEELLIVGGVEERGVEKCVVVKGTEKKREPAQQMGEQSSQETDRDEIVQAKDRELAQAQQQLRQLRHREQSSKKKIEDLQRQLQSSERENAMYRQHLQETEFVQAKDRELAQAQQQLRQLRQQEQSSRKEIGDLQRQLESSEALVAETLQLRDSELETLRAKTQSPVLPPPHTRKLHTSSTSQSTQQSIPQAARPVAVPHSIPPSKQGKYISGHTDSTPTHHYDKFPGVCFLGEQLEYVLSSKQVTISPPNLGVTLDIPSDAVPPGEHVTVTIQPCLSGVFQYPEGYEPLSAVYYISTNTALKKKGQLTLEHFGNLQTKEQTDNMYFFTANSPPVTVDGGKVYQFGMVKGGEFEMGENYGTISLEHFCLVLIGGISEQVMPAAPVPASDSLSTVPSLTKLVHFKISSGSSINIAEQIGANYTTFCTLLLEDHTGAITTAIATQHQNNAVAINHDILTRWLQGKGKKPVTWSTLVGVLKDVGLMELAKTVQKGL